MCDTVDGYVPKIGGRLYGNNSLISEGRDTTWYFSYRFNKDGNLFQILLHFFSHILMIKQVEITRLIKGGRGAFMIHVF